MGLLPALGAALASTLTYLGQDFPRFAPYATVLVGLLSALLAMLHPGLGKSAPWFAEDRGQMPERGDHVVHLASGRRMDVVQEIDGMLLCEWREGKARKSESFAPSEIRIVTV